MPQRVPATSSSRGAGAAGAVGNQGCAVIKGVGCPPPAAPGALEPLGRSGESGARVRRRHPARPGRPNAYARGGHQGCWVPATRSSRGAGAAGAVGRKWGPSDCLPFSHVLMAALKLTTSGVSNWCTISCSNPRASPHCLPFSHALMADDIWCQQLVHHLLQQSKSSLPLLALLTCTDARVETHNVWCQQLVHHLLQQSKGSFPLLALLTCTDGCIKAHNIWCQQLVHHLLQQSKGSFPLLALLTFTDGCMEAHDIWCQQLLHHPLQQIQSSLPLLTLLTCTDACIAAHDIW